MCNFTTPWEPPDPPQDPMEEPINTCPFCGSELTNVIDKYIMNSVPKTRYKCYDCDREWIKTDETVDDDDIPF